MKRSQRSIEKPAASIKRSVSRARWQPLDSRGQTVASAARCSERHAGCDETTCSKNRSSPAISENGENALGAQAGEIRLAAVFAEAGYGHWRRATETPFNLVLEARA